MYQLFLSICTNSGCATVYVSVLCLLYCRDDFTALLKGGQLCDTQSMKVSGGRMEMGMEERKCVEGKDVDEGREWDEEEGGRTECVTVCEGECPRVW